MPKKTEHDYAHKPTLFNLIACQRSSDNHIHMTGCLCHNIEAKHFWFDQPAVSRCVNSDMSAMDSIPVAEPDKSFQPLGRR